MFKIKIGNSDIIISGAIIPIVIIFYFSDYLGEYLKIYSYIALHELVHGIAAVMSNCQIGNVRITPGGISLELSDEITVKKTKLLILLAGPVTNLILAGLFNITSHETASQANLALFIFNLLPLKPLDGYEILKTLLNKTITEKIIKVISKIILIFLSSIVIRGFIIGQGSIISAVTFLFIISQMSKERMEGKIMNAKNLFDRRTQFQKRGYYEGKIITVLPSMKIGKILSRLSSDSFHFVYILDENFLLRGIFTEQQILNSIVDNRSDLTFGELLK